MAATTESLGLLRGYWESIPESPIKTEEIAMIDDLLSDTPVLTEEQWSEFFTRLEGPEGCNFQEGETLTWECDSGNDKSKAEAILTKMGLDDRLRERVLKLVDVFGGHCDCEILFNAEERILPQPEEGAA